MSDEADRTPPRTALILGGGGARAAYQIGVLDAFRQILNAHPDCTHAFPFKVLCGTSAGAINVAWLASRCTSFDQAVQQLVSVWSEFQPNDVFRTDLPGALANAGHWLTALSMGWLIREAPRSLFDNRPLRELLTDRIDFHAIDKHIAQGDLDALAISSSSYSSGHHVTFYQSRSHIRPWTRTQRIAERTTIGLEHLMASSAIPLVFPATQLHIGQHLEFFGDGAMRQSSPISPAIHLGAERIVVIGAGQVGESSDGASKDALCHQTDYPSLGQIGGHVMASIFLDGVASDVERLERINRTLQIMTEQQRIESELKPLELLSINPSQRLDSLAEPFIRNLPRTTRSALRLLGATGPRGVGLTSYLLFHKGYTQTLIEMGRQDGLKRAGEIAKFFSHDRA